jgi:DNA repair exonuclease SbcCD nuclease subunit
MNGGLNIIALADLHFGPTNNPEEIYKSLVEIVYPVIINTNPDMIVVCGDDTDERLDLSQFATRYYLQYIYDISHFRNKDGKPIAVRIISGTESHTKNQLQSLYYLVSDTELNVKLIETVTEENFNGNDILYVPEESVQSKEDYYSSTVYGEKKYDYAFGHGMFDFVAFSKDYSAEKSLRGAPTWTYDDFKRIIKKVVVFGHIHIRQNYKNFIYYPGSLTRFRQGENDPKGFLHIYNTTVTFIENPLAKQYVTYNLEDSSSTVEETVNYLINTANNSNISDLRVFVNRDDFDSSKLMELKSYFISHPEYKIRIEMKKSEVKNDITLANPLECGNNALSSKFPEITNPEDVVFNTIYYCKNALGYEITKEQMEEIVSKAKAFENGTLM